MRLEANQRGGDGRRRILFTGYAQVHFVCFLPVYRLLERDPRVEVWLSGGFPSKTAEGDTYTLQGFYDPFDVTAERVIPFEQSRAEDFDVVVCANTSTGLFPRSAKKSVQIFHGVSFRNLFARGDRALKFDLLCVPGAYHARLLRDRALVRQGGPHAVVTGFPKLDALVGEGLQREAILRAAGVDPARPTLLYAPTGSRNNSLETMGRDIIRRLGEEPSWNLLVKPHDHPKKKTDWFKKLAPLESDRVRLVRDLDIVPYMYAADLLLSDASSAAVEYTLLDRPIVFLDVQKLLRKVMDKDKTLDLETYGRKIGVCVAEPARVVETVLGALSNPGRESEIRRAMARDVFHEPGRATEHVKDVILHAAGLEDNLPPGVNVVEPAPVV